MTTTERQRLRERSIGHLLGDFANETIYSDDPQSVLDGYRALGARRVHLVDLDGARDGTQPNRPTVLLLAKTSGVKLQVGGGLRTIEHIRELFDAGVDRVALHGHGHAAVLRHALLGDVEVGHDLHARDHAGDHSVRDRGRLAQHAVHPEAHPHLAALGLEVDVALGRRFDLGHLARLPM